MFLIKGVIVIKVDRLQTVYIFIETVCFPLVIQFAKATKQVGFDFNFGIFVPAVVVSWTLQKVITESSAKIYQINLLFHVLLESVVFWLPNVFNKFVKDQKNCPP